MSNIERQYITELLRLTPNTRLVKEALAESEQYVPTTQTICRIARQAVPPVELVGGGRPVGAKDKRKRKQSSKHRIPVLELAEQGENAADIAHVLGLKKSHVQYFLRPPTDGEAK